MPLPNMAKGPAAYRFNLYRDPFVFNLKGNSVTVHTLAHYWLEVGVKVGGWVKGVGSCGLGPEGFRKVLLGVQADISLTPAWGLDLKVVPLEPEPMSTCEITALNYDITHKVVAGMKENLIKATQEMEKQMREKALLRPRVEAAWAQAQQPIEIAEGVFLMLNPEKIRLAPWSSQGKVLTLIPEIQARPALTLGTRPVATLKPLPDLETVPSSFQPGFRVHVDADLRFEHATAQLRRQMIGKVFETEKGTLQVLDASVRGENGKAVLEVELKGKVNGKLILTGRPVYQEATGTIQLQELDYTLESRSWITHFGEWLLRSGLRKNLAEKANWFMDKSLQDLKGQLQQGLNRPLAQGLSLSGTLSDLKFGQPQVLEDRFRLETYLEGQAQVDFSGNLPGF